MTGNMIAYKDLFSSHCFKYKLLKFYLWFFVRFFRLLKLKILLDDKGHILCMHKPLFKKINHSGLARKTFGGLRLLIAKLR